eukprot:2544490-Lingulodinium_polyedra.AAC.1
MPTPCSRHAIRSRSARDLYAIRVMIYAPRISQSALRAPSAAHFAICALHASTAVRRRSSELHV